MPTGGLLLPRPGGAGRGGGGRAEAEAKDGERALERAQELREQNVTSPEIDLEAAEATRDQRNADLQSARAALEVARVDLEHTTLRSPIDGVVIARNIALGQTVAAGPQAPPLFVIASDLERMQVETRIAEADIGRVHAGLPVSFRVDAYPDLTFHGAVAQVRLEPILEHGVVTYAIVVVAANPDQQLRPGMTAHVTVRVEHRDDALKVPNAALRFHPPGGKGGGTGAAIARKPDTVFVLRQGHPVPVSVATGLTDGTMTEVVAADLEPKEAVIVGVQTRPPRRRP